ncbi:MAG: glycosyltransferase [Pseudomonadota bacterium]
MTSKDKISLCMITKDEEEFLPKCLDSVNALVDEMVIVDTGSSDRTVEIAKSLGAKVFHHPWENDYSKHRNQSISYATSEWILVMDADEVVAPRDLPRIRQMLQAAQADGFLLILRNYDTEFAANMTLNPDDYEEGRGYTGFIEVPLVRLFRNDPSLFFIGKVHETVTKSFEQSGKLYHKTDIPIHHFGKALRSRKRRKQELYLRLGIERLKEQPNDPMAHKGLAEQYLDLGMPDKALEILDRGVVLFPDMVELRFNRGLSLDRLGRYEEARTEYESVLDRKPDHVGATHNLAQICLFANHPAQSIELLERGIDLGMKHPGIFFVLGRAYDTAGDWDRALMNFDRALTIQPNCPNVNCHKALAFLNRGMYPQALAALEKEIEIGGNLPDAYSLLGQMSMRLGDRESAAQFFQKTLTIAPDHKTARLHLEKLELSNHCESGTQEIRKE